MYNICSSIFCNNRLFISPRSTPSSATSFAEGISGKCLCVFYKLLHFLYRRQPIRRFKHKNLPTQIV